MSKSSNHRKKNGPGLCSIFTVVVILFLVAVAILPDTQNLIGFDVSIENKG